MAAHRIAVFVLLACALSTAPFGSMEQGSPTAAHAVAGSKAASWAPPVPTKLRIPNEMPGSAEWHPGDPPLPFATAPRPGRPVDPVSSGVAMSTEPWRGPGPCLTYRATAPPPQDAS